MSVELSLLKLLESNKNHKRFSKFVKKNLVTRETHQIVQDLGKYHEIHPATDELDWEDFSVWFRMFQHPHFDPDQLEIYGHIFTKLSTYSVPSDSDEILKNLLARETATSVMELTTAIADGDTSKDLQSVIELVKDYERSVGISINSASMLVSSDMTEVLASISRTGGLQWRLESLTLAMGELIAGDFVAVGARPNTGKTSFLASEVTYMAQQIPEDHSILCFTNEEKGEKFAARCYSAHFNEPLDDIEEDIELYKERWEDEIGSRMIILHDKTMHYRAVEEWMDDLEGRTSLVLIDQLYNLHGFGQTDNEVNKLAHMFRWAREKADKCPLIIAHQLKGEAYGMLHPPDHMFYGSTTLIQGACDAMIAIGRESPDKATHAKNVRGIWVPKNKMPGKKGEHGKYCDAKFYVYINSDTGRFTE